MRALLMSRAARLGIAGFLLAFVLAPMAGAQEKAKEKDQPTIVIEKMRYELGEQYEQKVYRQEFKIKNTGTANLEIKQVKPG
jgi:hypothetical protein